MEVHFLEKNSDYHAVLEVLLELRSAYSLQTLSDQIEEQQFHGYQVVYVKKSDAILAVAGFSIGQKLAWGKHIYIDDLVTNTQFRSNGVGKFFMDWFKSFAASNGCGQIHLDSGVQRFPAHRFYLREIFNIASHHFSFIDVNRG